MERPIAKLLKKQGLSESDIQGLYERLAVKQRNQTAKIEASAKQQMQSFKRNV